jgi:predicted  nucleic acid-binding Zn-ribbon protein
MLKKAETQEYVDALMAKVNLLRLRLIIWRRKKKALQNEINAIEAKIKKTEAEIEQLRRK